jgi:hypothetical protein
VVLVQVGSMCANAVQGKWEMRGKRRGDLISEF